MRRPSFKRWITRECCVIAHVDSFSFVRLLALAQSPRKGSRDNVSRRRLAAALHLHAMANGCLKRLHNHTWNAGLREKQKRVESALGARDLERLALRGMPLLSLPVEYRDILQSFYDRYYQPEFAAEEKAELCEKARALQLQAGVASADIARATGIAAPNVVAFLKHGDTGRVTVEGATRMVDYLTDAAAQAAAAHAETEAAQVEAEAELAGVEAMAPQTQAEAEAEDTQAPQTQAEAEAEATKAEAAQAEAHANSIPEAVAQHAPGVSAEVVATETKTVPETRIIPDESPNNLEDAYENTAPGGIRK